MRIILLVLLFLIWESATPASVQWQWIPTSLGIPLFFSGYCLLVILMRFWGRRLARGIVSGDFGRAVDRFNFGLSVARFFIPLCFAGAVFTLGWKSLVDSTLSPLTHWRVYTPGTLLAITPAFMAWMGLWWAQFPVDRALREQNVLYQLEADLPIFTPPNFRDYFINKLRVQLLFTIVPLLLILVLRDIAAVAITVLSRSPIGQHFKINLTVSDSIDSALSFAAVLFVLLLAPALLRYVLHTQRLPESSLRQSLSSLCEDAGIRCREILLWRTQNNMGNAAVMGLIPQVRYVLLSDLLLESMTDLQIQAVFAHELGHVKHRHLAWFILFFLTVSGFLVSLAALLETHLHLSDAWRSAFELFSTLTCGMILLIGYGFLSRWFERQADVFAARTIETPAGEAINSDGFGAAVFASALERVAVVNNIPINARNWTHGSIQSRVTYMHRLGRDPRVAERFDRNGRRVFIGLIILVLTCGSIAIYAECIDLLN